MTDTTVPPATRRYSEHIHALLDRPTREALLGMAILDARGLGYTLPREGEMIRRLIDMALLMLKASDSVEYARAVEAGRVELDRRQSARRGNAITA